MFLLSLPMRERGLKWNEWFRDENLQNVAPHAGAWIEMLLLIRKNTAKQGRSPCGSVD